MRTIFLVALVLVMSILTVSTAIADVDSSVTEVPNPDVPMPDFPTPDVPNSDTPNVTGLPNAGAGPVSGSGSMYIIAGILALFIIPWFLLRNRE